MVLIMERSMFSQLLFWRQQEEDGHTTLTQRTRYMRQWHSWFRFIPEPVLYVLLRIPHEDDARGGCDDQQRLQRELRRVQRRIQARGRGEEMSKEDQDRNGLKTSLGNQDDAGEPLDQEFMRYNGQLLERHEAYWPSGTANPEQKLEKAAGCIHFDAGRPYDVDDKALQKAAREIAGYLSTSLVLAGYGPDYAQRFPSTSRKLVVQATIQNGHVKTTTPTDRRRSKRLVSRSK